MHIKGAIPEVKATVPVPITTKGVGIFSWNIARLERSVHLAEWLTIVKIFDICCFQETWHIKRLTMEGFACYHNLATPSPAAKPAGGLAIWVNVLLKVRVVDLSTKLKSFQI